MWYLILEQVLFLCFLYFYECMTIYYHYIGKKLLAEVPHPCHLHPHPHSMARSSKTICTIFLKLSDIVPNNITVTNLH